MAQPSEEAGASRPQPDTSMRDLGALAIAISLFAMAVLIAWDASSYPFRRSYAQFGPEIFPYIVAAGIAIFAALTVWLALREDGFPKRAAMAWAPVLWITGAIAVEFVLLTVGSGFVIASGTLFGFAARGLGRKPIWFTIFVGIVLSALLYLLFRHGLGLSLPAGPPERIIDGFFRR
ncbi:tripartite tricarboxylate transporter TctB family protein [Mesorhizobium sp. CAU 1732]|uniref:tripartite tricarboxylate transporter TctB family protein n=1 Tax=Mesorhizobium sp. CAU 1732 TaxID=3140358 RepID=UPI003260B3AD